MDSTRRLSKSKIMSGLQCPKRLWLEVYRPEVASVSTSIQRAFKIGHEVGEAARMLWLDGKLVGHDQDLAKAIGETDDLLNSAEDGDVVFEATVSSNRVLIRADILLCHGGSRLEVIEVKASTSLKPQYLDDCAIQVWVLESAGYAVEAIRLAHVDNQFVYDGSGDYHGLFQIIDVTADVRQRISDLPVLVTKLRSALGGAEPEIDLGQQCKKPYECPFIPYCSSPEPKYPVATLPGGSKIHEALRAEGFQSILDVPEGRLTNPRAEWVRSVTISGIADLKTGAGAEIEKLGWPRLYLDFETVGFAVPRWAGTRPYEALPFQWSCHVEQSNETVCHHEYLASGNDPPMAGFAESLLDVLGKAGPIFVYTSYERRILESLITRFPDYAESLRTVIGRLVDLHPFTRDYYYHPDMAGSWSLKKVLPTIAPDLDHSALEEITDGMEASDAFIKLIDSDLPTEERSAARSALLDYCELDTLALLRLAHFLAGKNGLASGQT